MPNERLFRVESPSVCAGIVTDAAGVVTEAAPVFEWAIGERIEAVRAALPDCAVEERP